MVGLISFADNLQSWNELFTQFWIWLGSISFGDLIQSVLRVLGAMYELVANLLLGWVGDDKLRDSFMLFGALLGVLLVRVSLFKRLPLISISVYIYSVTAVYLSDKFLSLRRDGSSATFIEFWEDFTFEIALVMAPGLLIIVYLVLLRPRKEETDFSFAKLNARQWFSLGGILFLMFSWSSGIGMDWFDVVSGDTVVARIR